MDKAILRTLPKVDEVITRLNDDPTFAGVAPSLITDAARLSIDAMRSSLLDGSADRVEIDVIVSNAAHHLSQSLVSSLRPVINATGIVLHTNLGRSPLAPEAVEAVAAVAAGYSTLEYDTQAMARGSRHTHVEDLICELTGAQAAIAVNNNAAAVMMVLSEFARGRQAVVSRGELIEIGGSFRIPDIMEQSGCTMVEVGTTNKTHLADYERVIGADTAVLLKVHPSNYRLQGFTQSVSGDELRDLAHAHGILLYEDQGSGTLIRLDCPGFDQEPTVGEAVAAGYDLVSFSGDKLLGGPQAGIIVGTTDAIERLKKNPLARALRLDKMTLAALEATLRLYRDRTSALHKIPVLRMLSATPSDLRPAAERLVTLLEKRDITADADIAIVDSTSRAGGGSLPMTDIPSLAVAVTPKTYNAGQLQDYLIRTFDTPIITRVHDDQLLVDVRTVLSEEELRTIARGVARFFEASVEETPCQTR